MAIVILGGLVTSTLLNLFLVPALYLRFGRTARSAAAVEHSTSHVDFLNGRLAPAAAAD
jgi:hypothetical protein